MGSKDDDDHHRQFGVRHKMIAAATFGLFAVVMLVISLHFYLKYLQRRRRRRESRTNFELTHQISRADREVHTPEIPKTGLDPLFIATALPKSIHNSADHHGEVLECSICLSNIDDKATVRLLPNCKHVFHVECIDMWLKSNKTCPVCRTTAEPTTGGGDEQSDLSPAVAQPTAPPLMDEQQQPSSRLSSFRRALSRGRPQITVQPTAPPLTEEQPPSQMVSSFTRMLSRERSFRVQSCGDRSLGSADLERQ